VEELINNNMYYVCIEDNQVTSIVDYEPNVPDTVSIETITNAKFKSIADGKSYYDAIKREVVKVATSIIKSEEKSKKALEFLNDTDWKVLRHIRETGLGIEPSLSAAEYIKLEKERQKQSKLVK
jgi:hypothetical protein